MRRARDESQEGFGEGLPLAEPSTGDVLLFPTPLCKASLQLLMDFSSTDRWDFYLCTDSGVNSGSSQNQN